MLGLVREWFLSAGPRAVLAFVAAALVGQGPRRAAAEDVPDLTPSGADLVLTCAADASRVLAGHSLTYTVTVTNRGSETVKEIALVDALPARATLTSLEADSGWSCSAPAAGGSGQVRCTTPAMEGGASARFVLCVAVDCATPEGALAENAASVASSARDPGLAAESIALASVPVAHPAPRILDLDAQPSFLWPLDRKFRTARLSYRAIDSCGASLVPTVTVTSDQQQLRRGSDSEVLDPHEVLLRAEVEPFRLAGRTYTVTLTAVDSAGAAETSSVDVRVLPWLAWVESAQQFAAVAKPATAQ